MANRNKKSIIVISLIAAMLIAFFVTKQLNHKQNTNNNGVVTVSINGPIGEPLILEPTQVSLGKSATVFDVLTEVLKAKKMQFEYSGGGKLAYINGINNLYEFDKGPESGWMYKVDGEFPSASCGMYELKNGQSVEWVYTLDLGKDVGAAEGTWNKQGE